MTAVDHTRDNADLYAERARDASTAHAAIVLAILALRLELRALAEVLGDAIGNRL